MNAMVFAVREDDLGGNVVWVCMRECVWSALRR